MQVDVLFEDAVGYERDVTVQSLAEFAAERGKELRDIRVYGYDDGLHLVYDDGRPEPPKAKPDLTPQFRTDIVDFVEES